MVSQKADVHSGRTGWKWARTRKRFIGAGLLFAALIFPAGPSGAAQTPRADFRLRLLQGIEKGFDLDEKGALAELSRAVEMDRENPLGHAFVALAHLYLYETGFDPKERERSQEAMLRAASEALAKGEKRRQENRLDGDVHLGLALAKLARVRWQLMGRHYLAAAQEAGNIWEDLEAAGRSEPENYDVFFPIGLLHYHLDQLSGLARFVSSWLIAKGDRKRGLEELNLAAERGELLKTLARAELLSVYSNREKQLERALALARRMKEEYPHNFNFTFALANILSEMGRPEEAFALAQGIEDGIRSGSPPFHPRLWSRLHQLRGKIYLDQGDYEGASPYFQAVVRDESPGNARVRAWALVRLGMIHDARRERKTAQTYYRKALAVEGGEGLAQVAARRYLKEPYSPERK
ncbi:MAG: tetratricopeptide repeat protein [Deltaproteobacteria bacterium]|nr:tetratricopeptide repeat protein [Deltaproteobacteria bacterium]